MTLAPNEQSQDGSFARQEDAFTGWVKADGSTPHALEAGRYHLYVSWACPWAHRTILARKLMGLEEALGLTAVDPLRDGRGWHFLDASGRSQEPLQGFQFLSEAYLATDPSFVGRYTVPVLWDQKLGRIVSNNDDDILRMLGTEFAPLAKHPVPLYPLAQREEINRLNDWIYPRINNGVYKAGFAKSQRAYQGAVLALFEALDELEARLARRRYLVAEQPVETDWRLFVTLIRFDAVYVGHFKCNLRRIADYPHLSGYLRDLYQLPGVAETVNFDEIKRHYYMTHPDINPTRVVPLGPELKLDAPHGREAMT